MESEPVEEAVKQVRTCLISIKQRPECQVKCDRNLLVDINSRRVNDAIEAKAENKAHFETFANKLVTLLTKLVNDAAKLNQSFSVKRQHLWRNFHELRSTTIEALWKGFLTKLSITDIDDHLVFQLLVDSVFEEIVHEEFEVSAEPVKSIKSVLTQDEQNIIRYAVGYFAQRLLIKHKKIDSEKAASYVECLSHMAVDGNESSLMDYTKEWTEKINRGGLFEVSTVTFQLFQAIEIAVCDKLATRLQTGRCSGDKTTIIDVVAEDHDVQFYWSLNSSDVDESESSELLKDIITLWVMRLSL